MSAQKLVILAAVAAFVVLTTTVSSAPQVAPLAANNSHHFVVGFRQPGDRLVLRQSIVKDSSWMKVVTVEKTFNVSTWERITLLQALDQKTNGNGAFASLLGGGPGTSNVTLKFKSQRGHGINFLVELYAR